MSDDPLEEQSSTDPFDVDGSGFIGGGLGDEITLIDSDAVHLNIYANRVAAHNMIDFSEPDDLPATEDVVTPVGWDF